MFLFSPLYNLAPQGTFTAVFCYGRTDHRTHAFSQFPLLASKRVYAYFLGSFTHLGRDPHRTSGLQEEEPPLGEVLVPGLERSPALHN